MKFMSRAAAFTTALLVCMSSVYAVDIVENAEPKTLDISFSQDNMSYSIEQAEKPLKEMRLSEENTGADNSQTDESELPSVFDLRNSNTVTPVKNQQSTQSCWAFSAIACAEQSLVSKGLANSTADLSESALTWFGQNTAIGSNEGTKVDDPYQNGGNWITAALAMSRFSGVEYEDDAPFLDGTAENAKLSDRQRDVCEYHLRSAQNIPKENTADIKAAVMNNGGVSVSYFTNEKYFSADNESYYCPNSSMINHSVTIIGWDDDYSKENFSEDNRPENNGAWLVKGSWGGFSQDGCYYISYEEPEMKYFCTYEMEENSNADNVYTYTNGTNMVLAYAENSITGANVFTAEKEETLSEVSFFLMNTKGENVDYKISVYRSPNSSDPQSGEKISQMSGSVCRDGFYTVKTENDPEIKAGEKFSVVLTLEYSGTYSYILCEGGGTSQSGSGESFVSTGGKWYDCKTSGYNNIYINAYTSDVSEPDKDSLKELADSYSETAGMAKSRNKALKTAANKNASVSDVRNSRLLLNSAAEKKDSRKTISTAEEWNEFAESVAEGNTYKGKIVYLENDIDFTDCDFVPVGSDDNAFEGYFDGNGYTLSSIECVNTDGTASVFPLITSNSVVSDLTVKDSSFTGKDVGAIVGKAEDSYILRCGFNGNITAEEQSGLIAAQLINSKADSCYGNSKSDDSEENLFGLTENSFVSNSYADDTKETAYMLNTVGGEQYDSGDWCFDEIPKVANYGKEPVHKITFNVNDDIYLSYSDSQGKAEFPQIKAEDGYKFRWYLDNEQINENNIFTADTTVTAKAVKAESFTITYKLNGGVNSEDNPVEVNEGDTVELAAPEREGYVFAGWYADSEFTSEPIEVLSDISQDNVLYAKWEKQTFTVTYIDNFGNTVKTQTVNYGENAEEPAASYVKGLKFDHWEGSSENITEDTVISAVYNVVSVDLSECTVDNFEECVYDGTAKTQENLEVSYGSAKLKAGEHYSISYVNNVSAGTAYAVVKGTGSCKGVKTVTFKIEPKTAENVKLGYVNTRYFTGSEIRPSLDVYMDGKKMTYSKDYYFTYTDNINAGVGHINVNFKGNYKGTVVKDFNILSKRSNELTYSEMGIYVYEGKAIEVLPDIYNGDVRVQEGTDFDVEYINNDYTGLAIAKITFKGNYSGIRLAYYTIYPQRPEDLKVEKTGDSSLTVSWNEIDGAFGYRIEYSDNENFRNSRYKTVVGKDKTSYTLSGLNKGSTYYVRLTAYTQINERIKAFGKASETVVAEF